MATDTVRVSRHGGAVRLTLPARVANDLGALQKSLGSLAERLGHAQCATGCDILDLMMEREFILTEGVALNPQPLPPLARGPLPDPWRVSVTVPDHVSQDINSLKKAIGVVVGKLGCAACCSGFDIQFQREIATMHLDEKLNVTHFGGVR